MTGHVEIRRAGVDDAEPIARIHVAAWRAAYAGLVPQEVLDGLSVEKLAARWRETIAQGQAEVVVAEAAGRPAGFCEFADAGEEDKPAEVTGEIRAIYIDPAHWRGGLGGALMEWAERALAARGKREVILWAFEGNAGGRAFYQARGYRADGARKSYSPKLDLPIIRFVKTLSV